MESRTLISGCSSNSRISLIGRSEKSIDLSLVRSQKLVFLKTHNFSKLELKWAGARRGVECRSSVERVEGVVGVEGFESESSVGLRRKKLGVFVSGGGSNFRSIHDGTVGGSVHGDVAVVVTNKPETEGIRRGKGRSKQTCDVLIRRDLNDLESTTSIELNRAQWKTCRGSIEISKALNWLGKVKNFRTVIDHTYGKCGGAEYARSKGIPVIVFPKGSNSSDGVSAVDLVDALRAYGVDFVLLAGYLKLIPVELVRAYPKSILNIHPALLPAFGGKGYYGMKVHKAVIASGARFSGPTVHFVDEHYDTGRILAQGVVPVLASDTAEELAARVLHEEHKLYVEAASTLCDERIVWREDGVPLIRSRENPNEYC